MEQGILSKQDSHLLKSNFIEIIIKNSFSFYPLLELLIIMRGFFFYVLLFSSEFFILNSVLSAFENKSGLMKRAESEYAKANYKKAFSLFKEAIKQGEKRGEARFFMGMILESKRNYSKSVGLYREAIELPLKKEYLRAALWKLVLYLRQMDEYEQILEYADRLKEIIGENKRLMEFIEEAELNSSPTQLEARNILNSAKMIENELAKYRKDKNFWEEHAEDLEKLAGMYEDASNLADRFKPFLWRSASYYENLNQLERALQSYRNIFNDTKSLRANYKIGVLLKKQMLYEEASQHLIQVLEEKKIRPILKYYTYLNLSQIYYALNNYEESKKNSLYALKKKFSKYMNKPSKQITGLLNCNVRLHAQKLLSIEQTDENLKKLASFKNDIRFCRRVLKNFKLSSNKKNANIHFLHNLLQAKINHWKYLSGDKKDALEFAERYYILTFLPDYYSEKKSEFVEKEISEGVYVTVKAPVEKERLSGWLFSEVAQIAFFLHQKNSFKPLHKILLKYPHFLKENELYPRWLADASFSQGDYQTAAQAYERLYVRDLEQEQKLLFSYLSLERWSDFRYEFTNYIKYHPDLREKLMKLTRSEPWLQKVSSLEVKTEYDTFLEQFFELSQNTSGEKIPETSATTVKISSEKKIETVQPPETEEPPEKQALETKQNSETEQTLDDASDKLPKNE